MIKNYFKIAWRNLGRNKGFSFINITGLAIGMAVAMLVGLWTWNELSFNSYYPNHERLAQVMLNQTEKGEIYTGETIAMPLGDALRTQHAADFKYVSLSSWDNNMVLAAGDNKIPGKGRWVQRDFPKMFSLAMLQGNRNALEDPSTLLLSQSLAKALFGDTDPLNQIVRLDNRLAMKVGGVYKDMPHNTSFYETKLLLPWGNKANWMNSQTSWSNHCGVLFVQLNDKADINQVNEKIKSVPTPHVEKLKEEIMLHPLDKLYLYNEFKNGKVAGGRIQFVWLIGIIGVFVLLLACINFMNLATARSEKRTKEIGIRKAIGSLRKQLVEQFLVESILTVLCALSFSILFVQLSLPFFNNLSDKQMVIPWDNLYFWMLILGFALFTGLISGSYPAFYLSSFQPVKVLKGVFSAGRFASLPRKVLVVTQFSISIILVVGTITVFRQIQYAKDRPAGYTRDGLISMPLSDNLNKHFNALTNDLEKTGVVKSIAGSSQPASHFSNNNSIEWRDKDPSSIIFFRNVNVTTDFGKTVDWKIKEGRDFSGEFSADSGSVILNETGAAVTGLKNPLGEWIKYGKKTYVIVGIVKDMLTQSPYEPMQPTVFFNEGWMGVLTIRVTPSVTPGKALAAIAPVFKKYDPENVFTFRFVDDVYAEKYANEVRIASLSSFFAVLAIFISCLGLFGLASFIAEQRTKEIGVRKVLGATIFKLWKMQSKDFVALVVISCLIAIPIAWYFLNQWLQNYSYRAELSWWIFGVSISGALIITIITVSFQAIKAAMMNPVKSLRTE